MSFTIDDLALEHLSPGFGTIIIIVSRRRIGDLEVAVDPQHVEVVVDGHSFEGETCAGRTVSRAVFTPSTRVGSIRRARGWSLVQI